MSYGQLIAISIIAIRNRLLLIEYGHTSIYVRYCSHCDILYESWQIIRSFSTRNVYADNVRWSSKFYCLYLGADLVPGTRYIMPMDTRISFWWMNNVQWPENCPVIFLTFFFLRVFLSVTILMFKYKLQNNARFARHGSLARYYFFVSS